MENLIFGLENSLRSENWYSSLLVAMTLIDIAGNYRYPTLSGSGHTKSRYIKRFNDDLADKYRDDHDYSLINSELIKEGSRPIPNLSLLGDDFYALRCSLLHEGMDDISRQSAQKIFNNIILRSPGAQPGIAHLNRWSNGGVHKLDIMVTILCGQILASVSLWWLSLTNDEKENINNEMLYIYPYEGSPIDVSHQN